MSEVPKGAPAAPAALVVPDYLKAMTGTQQTGGAVDSIASAAMSIPRISMRSKKFRFMEGGEEVLVVSDAIEVVIVGVEPEAQRFIKSFYAQAYGGANANNPPDCASDDGVRPSGWIQNPQSPTCAECPKNRFGSAQSRTGKAAKACRDSKRLWVNRREDLGKPEKAVLYALGVPVTSLKNLAEFGRGLKGLNVPISAAVCKVKMDDDSEYPLITFECSGFLPEADAKLAIERGTKEEWKLGQVSRQLQAPVPNVALPGQPLPGQPPVHHHATTATGGTATPPPAAVDPAKVQKNVDDIVKNW
jgi:hypothetical protein